MSNKEKFKKWLKENGNADSTISNYILYLDKHTLNKLIEENLYSKNIFDINDIKEIEKIVSFFDKNQNLKIFNKDKRSFPKSSLKKYIDFLKQNLEEDKTIETKNNEINIKNIILYGTAGVGKTHNYQHLISMIEEGKNEKEIFDSITDNTDENEIILDKKTFKTIKDDGRVEFVTFHQSYSYEDFIEGFRPNENGNIKLEDGIFKILSDKASKNLDDSKKDNIVLENELHLLTKFKNYINRKIENGEELKLQRGDNFYLIKFEDNKLYFKATAKSNVNEEFNLNYDDFTKIYNSDLAKNTLKDISSILGTNSVQQKYAYYLQIHKDFIENEIEDEVSKQEIENTLKNYYIVIDEINRGNISKIFGELITLIEEDKRDGYEVTLQYSKEKFKVPSNLYIIATMNSSDKSIATIDIALRRRFTFLKMLPNLALVKNNKAQELMKELNIYIKNTIGEDYMLGHSYFMKVENEKDLNFIKKYKIEPLLEEYFYGDEKSLEEAFRFLKV